MQFFRIASILLIVIGISHLTGHFLIIPYLQLQHGMTSVLPSNEVETELLRLMNHYHKHIGGTPISMMDIQNGLSLVYALFFLWTGVLNLLLAKGLVRNKRLLSQISFLNAFVLLIGAWISYVYFFWLPLVSFIISAAAFIIAPLRMRREF